MPAKRAAKAEPDLVRVLEAVYDLEADEGRWMQGVLDAIRPALDDGLGLAAYIYDTSKRPFEIRGLIHDVPIDPSGVASLMDESNDEYVRRSWIARSAMTASETPGYDTHPGVLEVFHPAGIHDIMVINALDPIGIGCWIGAPLRKLYRLEGVERERWNRVAAHVRSALRLRLRLAARSSAVPSEYTGDTGDIEAVLTRDGKVEHVEPSAASARTALHDAVLGMERARNELRHDIDRALPSWKALVQARWTLIDDFHSDGSRYVVARANGFSSMGTALLTPRERQVMACIAIGQTNKEAAYELGLSPSTVRVLVARASAKLGASTRDELVAKYRASNLG